MIWDSCLVPICLLESEQTPEQTHPASGLASSGLEAAGAWLLRISSGRDEMPQQRGWQWSLPHRGLGAKRVPASGAGDWETGGRDSELEAAWIQPLGRTSPHHSDLRILIYRME